jgi:uncharacterized repeat protein (TIGR03803 family)
VHRLVPPGVFRCFVALIFCFVLLLATAPAQTFSVLHNFTGGIDGSNPFAGLTLDAAGHLYGTTGAGGPGNCSYDNLTGCGTAFRLNHVSGGWTFSPLYSFQGGSDGDFSTRPMTIGPNGSLYGTTLGGGEGTCTFDGATGCGILFNLAPSPTFPRTPLQPWLEKILYRFSGAGDGGIPFSSPLFEAGNIYGTSAVGGAHNFGTVFEFVPAGGGNWTENVLYSFAGGSDGRNPSDGLTADNAGNFYGTTEEGGGSATCTNGCGVVFELSPSGSGWTERILYSFQGTTDGMYPNSGVVMDAAGNLYGNTWEGGSGGGGTVYKLTPSGSGNYSFSVIYSVPVAGFAVGRVALDSAGNVYEALQNGGPSNDGQVFKLTPSNGSYIYTDLHDFTGGNDGSNAIGGVVLDPSGNLYGTTLFGGANTCNAGAYGCGVVYEIMP